jgi:hypothetical protein
MKLTAAHIHRFREDILSCNVAKVNAFLDAQKTFVYTTKTLVGFHDALLLLMAYPPTKKLFERADDELNNYYLVTTNFIDKNPKAEEELVNTGLSGTEVQGAFTFPLLNALRKASDSCLYLHSYSEDAAPAGEVLKYFLPASEFETLGMDVANDELTALLLGEEDQLPQLLSCMESSSVRADLRDQLFANLKLFAGIQLDGSIPDRSTARGLKGNVHVHSEILKKVDPLEVVNRKLPTPAKLTRMPKEKLILNSMCMLATLNRETDPVTVCDHESMTVFHLERGVTVALFSMEANRRMPLESYIGYVLFKNGLPMAYGGSWIFGNRALFGINIFEPYRGGESSLTILQLLRVYRQHYGVDAFSVEPYQFGKDNPEGIQSGAYWFYYKMGFRSDDNTLAALAEKEFEKMRNKKSFRSSESVLLRFTDSRVTWKIDPRAKLFPDPSVLSLQITTCVREHYAGNRAEAIKAAASIFRINRTDQCADHLLLFLSRRKHHATMGSAIVKLAKLKRENEQTYNSFLKSLVVDYQ